MSKFMTKPPSSFALEAAMTALLQAREQLMTISPNIAEDVTLYLDSLEGLAEGDPLGVIDRIVDRKLHLEDMRQVVGARKTDLAQRGARLEREEEYWGYVLCQFLDALRQKSLERPTHTLSIHDGLPELILEEEKLAERFLRVYKTPNKTEIRQALKAGEHVNGAELGDKKPILTIRTK
jgi:hypothetical protein